MSSDDIDRLKAIREFAANIAITDGLPMMEKWHRNGVDPMVSCLALIRLAYTLSPTSLNQTEEGPESFGQLCKLVAQKDGILEEFFHLNDNQPQ